MNDALLFSNIKCIIIARYTAALDSQWYKKQSGEKENNCAWCFCSVIEKSEQKLMGLSYVPQGVMKSFVFFIFSCVCLATSLYMFFILLETKGKTALEIAEEFRKIRGFGSPTESKCLETKL